jgi:hypothetical protein
MGDPLNLSRIAHSIMGYIGTRLQNATGAPKYSRLPNVDSTLAEREDSEACASVWLIRSGELTWVNVGGEITGGRASGIGSAALKRALAGWSMDAPTWHI